MGHALKNWVTTGEMGHTWKNGSHLEKWVTLRKLGHTWKKLMGHTWKNRSHLEKWVKFRKMGHTWRNGLQLEKCFFFKKWVTVREKVTLWSLGHTWKNVSQLEEWDTFWKKVTLGKKITFSISSEHRSTHKLPDSYTPPYFRHRCEKSGRESTNSRHLITKDNNNHARTHDICLDPRRYMSLGWRNLF